MKKDTIIYIGGFDLVNKSASSHRPIENSIIFKILDYKTVIIGVNKKGNRLEKIKNDNTNYDGWIIPYPSNILSWIKYLSGISSFKKVLNEYNDVRYVICYNYQSIAFWRLLRYCNKKGIKVISDCTEWYGDSEKNIMFRIVKYLDTNIRMKYLNKKADGLMVISYYLEEYYKKIHPLRMPMLFSIKKKIENICVYGIDRAELAYAGIPFRLGVQLIDRHKAKDRLDIVISMLYKLKMKSVSFNFNIYGITSKQYLKVFPEDAYMLEKLKDSIVFHGYTESEELREKLSKSDYTILFREENKVTLSGFPTKFSESLKCGTPVIATKIGDVGYYLKEGENGFFIDINDEEEALKKLEGILKSSTETKLIMKKKCIQYDMFEPINWVDKVRSFLLQINNDTK
jgi:glycosyltransferase involved in cell wall biosynthesis